MEKKDWKKKLRELSFMKGYYFKLEDNGLVEKKDEPDEVEQKLFDEYEISMDSFHKLICKLAPMCEVGQSPLSNKKYRGFADIENSCFIARVDT